MNIYFIDMLKDEGTKFQKFTYPAGEIQVRLFENQIEEVQKADKVVITAYVTDGNPMPVLLLASAIGGLSTDLYTIVLLPYLAYSRADRRFVPGDCFAIETFLYTLSSSWFVDEIITFDVHSRTSLQLTGTIANVPAEDTIVSILSQLPAETTILLPDKGSLSRYDLSKFFNHKVGCCDKVREPGTGKLTGFTVPEIHTEHAIIIDDLCDAGGTFSGLAAKIKETQPEVKLYLYVSHGIFSKGLGTLNQYFEHIWTTDSFPSGMKSDSIFTIIPIGGTLKASILTTAEQFQQVQVR